MAKMTKEAGRETGLFVTGQGFRHLFVKTLVNDPSVSQAESLVSARHRSVAAQLPYQDRDHVSEANKFRVLGLYPPIGFK